MPLDSYGTANLCELTQLLLLAFSPRYMKFPRGFISLADLYVAYRKAKKEAFSETNCAHGLKFSYFEKNLDVNLRTLLHRINESRAPWHGSADFLGRATCIPKAIIPADEESSHLNISDPLADWKRRHQEHKAKTEFRIVIDATVNFQILSALWVIKVGHYFDASLDSRYAVGNRLKRWRAPEGSIKGKAGPLNLRSHALFQPYYHAYGAWRRRGLTIMTAELTADRQILAVTMDLRRFYHKVDPSFLLNPSYQKLTGVQLSRPEIQLTRHLVKAIATWNQKTEEQFKIEQRGLPVGLTSSGVIANILLKEFDDRVVEELKPIYYGRYVDDIFLVLRYGRKFSTSQDLMLWFTKKLGSMARYEEEPDDEGNPSPILRIALKYAKNSDLLFAGKKQKIFQLEGKSGLDLIAPIEEQIKRQRSERRGLPNIPDTESEMIARTLLVTSDATLDADSLRKAEVATLRRAGFATLLGSFERHAKDLDRRERDWRTLRLTFYGLAERQLLTPSGFFDFLRYFPRILELMIACDDLASARKFVKQLGRLIEIIRSTCVIRNHEMNACCQTLSGRLVEAVLKAQFLHNRKDELLPIFRTLRASTSRSHRYPITGRAIENLGEQLFLADWSRKRYSQAWLESSLPKNPIPKRPKSLSVRAELHLDTIDRLKSAASLVSPQWPALAFPTRPLTIAEVTAYAPSLVEDYQALREIILGLRGSWMSTVGGLRVIDPGNGSPKHILVPAAKHDTVRIAVTNFLTHDHEWVAAAKCMPSLSLSRYRRLNDIVSQIVRQSPRPTYALLPECSLPRRWARNVSLALSFQGISLIAGLEYRRKQKGLQNEALVSLVSDFGGNRTNICIFQTKLAPAWHENELLLKKASITLNRPQPNDLSLPVYVHDRFCFGVLICSDLTTLANRNQFQGYVDCVFVPEWNQDLETFATLIEATAHDMHAYMIQANNRQFGDSRIRGPYKLGYRRDVVRVKGGLHDYLVIGEIDFLGLRKFQRQSSPPEGKKEKYKPFPIGYTMSDRRRYNF